MKIGGLQKTSLLDYPGYISAIVWTNGCNFRCPFCYNPSLALGNAVPIPEEEIFSFLEKRKSMIEGVVFTGGEPLLQEDIIECIQKVKALGFLVKIDTNGTNPVKLKEILEKKLVDYVAMDVKAPKEKYRQLSSVNVDISLIESSIDVIKTLAPAYEFRTTMIPELLKKEDIIEIGKWINGAKKYCLQQFKQNTPLLSSKLEHLKPYSKEQLKEFAEAAKPFVQTIEIRGI